MIFFSNGDKIDFIKIDIEGLEMRALERAKNILLRNKNVRLLTEFHPKDLMLAGTEPRNYLEFLYQLGFTIYDVNESNFLKEPASIPGLIQKYAPEKNKMTNLFCIRREIS